MVGIESKGAARTIIGSGFVATSDGFILTLASVVPQGYEVRVYLGEGKEFVRADVLRRDLQQNLAIIRVERQNLQTAGFASADSLQLGSPIVMVAKSLEAGELITIVNEGSVRTRDEKFVRTSMFDKSVLGGAPVFDLKGRVAGLSIFAPDGRLVAIPSAILRAFSGF